mmetsp:Transcript_11545/g.35578  ORF Transcript_11545/g.35578 Transcript_11545/m.35578 type:complete len:205 (+) Transcript_11545:731-1345(+)
MPAIDCGHSSAGTASTRGHPGAVAKNVGSAVVGRDVGVDSAVVGRDVGRGVARAGSSPVRASSASSTQGALSSSAASSSSMAVPVGSGDGAASSAPSSPSSSAMVGAALSSALGLGDDCAVGSGDGWDDGWAVGSGGQPQEARQKNSATPPTPRTAQRGSGRSSTQSQFFEGAPFLYQDRLFTQSGGMVGGGATGAGVGAAMTR